MQTYKYYINFDFKEITAIYRYIVILKNEQ